ncbi:MAG TPA: methyltransferase [Caulobacteraceae bacterium]
MINKTLGALTAATLIAGASLCGGAAMAQTSVPPYVTAAVADPARPQADRDLDAARKPAETLALIGIKPGDRVVDVFAGPYFDRLFADAVGPRGKVYMFIPLEVVNLKKAPVMANGASPFPDHPNVIALTAPINSFSVPESVDIVWIRQNYHDLYDPFMGPADVPAFDRAVFKALKPGGLFVVVDHSAPDGSGLASTNTTHRIDAARVKADMAATGFTFVGQSDLLRNPADPRTDLVFKPSIRGHTDQFIYLFRKP